LTEINVTDCGFRDCRSLRTYDYYGCGGACLLGAARVRVYRCCGLSCRATDFGQFLLLDSDGSSAGLGVDSHTVSEVSVLQCGEESTACDSGTLHLESPVAAAFRELNVTECAVYTDGGALFSESGSEPFSVTFFLVNRCDYSDTIVANSRSGYPTIDYANFYQNTPSKYLLYGNSYGMKLRNCIFVTGNSEPLVYTESQKFDLDYCYFSGAAPATSEAVIGTNCRTQTLPPTYVVFGVNTGDCPAIPTATQSPRPTATQSPRPTGSRSSAFAPSRRLSASAAFAKSSPQGVSGVQLPSLSYPATAAAAAATASLPGSPRFNSPPPPPLRRPPRPRAAFAIR
jgi:hypothetical protein